MKNVINKTGNVSLAITLGQHELQFLKPVNAISNKLQIHRSCGVCLHLKYLGMIPKYQFEVLDGDRKSHAVNTENKLDLK